MPQPNRAALAFLETRRSRPHKTLTGPVPNHAELRQLLTAAARSPDHGKLEPWRFIILDQARLQKLAAHCAEIGRSRDLPAEQLDKSTAMLRDAPLSVAVIASPKPSDKIPQIEQHLSAGAVCLALLNACLASGWGANWLTGWTAMDREYLHKALGLSGTEFIAGYIHIGTQTSTPPDRPRPDIDAITDWPDDP